MITIASTKYTLKELPEELLNRLKPEVYQVQFGAFNIYDSELKEIKKNWIGELNGLDGFKLFRVTSSTMTSDIGVLGEFDDAKNELKVNFKVHWTAPLGLFGVITVVYVITMLFGKKGIELPIWFTILSMVVAGLSYGVWKVRDLRKSKQLFEKLMSSTKNENYGTPHHMQEI